ncbi:MAG: hypothetical protein COV36_05515 [Alphaproteobacteria bacterium CG11_big_fil_rev_8_21_14_0_20_44_7]|nr:MAG: hypothetical protein COV36_05515 [Alphaproteobacteria bacterium CG11_big_fil_rev_8_21_14_0_20_44_7]
MQNPVLWLIVTVIDIYMVIVIASVILSWLISFNIVNRYQPFVQQLGLFLRNMTEPVYARIRKVIPPIAGMDLSPLILLIALQFIQRTVIYLF